MPEMDGYQVCLVIKENHNTKDIPVIFITAKDDEADEERGLLLGAVDYIAKPLRPAIALARVKTHITLKLQYDRITELAVRDQLTQLHNRHYLLDEVERKLSYLKRHDTEMSLLMIDIDKFKTINDSYGHAVGDSVLVKVAQKLSCSARKEDIVSRFGGEEFVFVLDGCDLESASQKATELLQEIEMLNPDGIPVTVSMGVVEAQQGEAFSMIIKRADEKLYEAKNTGRNKVVI